MIAALLLRFGIPKWAAIAVLCALAAAGALDYRHHLIAEGERRADARHAVIDAANSAKAEAERTRLNGLVAQAQAQLNAAIADVAQLQAEVDREKAISSERQRRLLAGTERERVLIRVTATGSPGPVGQGQAAGTAAMDPGRAVTADLDGRVASDLEWLRQTRNDAIAGLRGCIASYDAADRATSH